MGVYFCFGVYRWVKFYRKRVDEATGFIFSKGMKRKKNIKRKRSEEG